MGRRLKVVVADDERDTREYFEFLLAHLGHDVRAAADGLQLVEVAREFSPDLIVTDYAMPGLDGLTAAARANRERPVPVVLISGRQDVDLAGSAGGLRVVRVLAKPVKEADLKAAVESVATEANAPAG
jgi:CheY-like chemotaxis protein